jgi:vacuolar-type H+-ATPase subunit C/Vma6
MAFEYLNARVKAWKGHLFEEKDYERFLTLEDFVALINALEKTQYAEDLEKVKARYRDCYTLSILDEALKENLTRTLAVIWDITEEKTRTLFNTFLVPLEIYNLKTVLRGVEKHIDFEHIYMQLLPTRKLDSAALKQLAHQKNIEQIISLLATWGHPCSRELKKIFPAYQKEHSLLALEVALDTFMYPSVLSSTRGNDPDSEVVRGVIRDKIDLDNLMTVIKLHIGRSHALPSDYYFIEGGRRLKKSYYIGLLGSKNLESLIGGLERIIADHRWRTVIKEVPLKDLALLEEKFETLIKRELCMKAVTDPLGISVSLCFILKKYQEIKNIRLIAASKELEIPPVETKLLLLS